MSYYAFPKQTVKNNAYIWMLPPAYLIYHEKFNCNLTFQKERISFPQICVQF